MERNGAFSPTFSVKGDERSEVEVGEHVAVDDDECVVDSSVGGGEAQRARGVERLGLHRVGQTDPRRLTVGVCLLERVGEVAQRKDRFVDSVGRQVGEHPFEHRHADNGQHLLRCRQGEGAQPRSLAAHEDNRLH